MDKTCFIIMPIADFDPYPIGHFKRVYEHIIKPACKLAGFDPIRADDILNTNYIALDIVRRIIDADIAICDLSGRNPNVFYELGVRQAFDLPVTLIRDSSTARVFDIQGFRDIEYDVTLRIDSVEAAVRRLAETIINTYESKGREVNSLISLLGIHAAKISASVEISNDTQLILNSLDAMASRISQFESLKVPVSPSARTFASTNPAPIFDFEISDYPTGVSLDIAKLVPGAIIQHPKFGTGTILKLEGSAVNRILVIGFKSGSVIKLMLNYAHLILLQNDPDLDKKNTDG